MFSKSSIFLFFLPILFAIGNGETVQTVIVRTADCFRCGMIEDLGQLDIKICGDVNCCFIQHLDNTETNFEAGDEDRFNGAAGLLECFDFQVKYFYQGPKIRVGWQVSWIFFWILFY